MRRTQKYLIVGLIAMGWTMQPSRGEAQAPQAQAQVEAKRAKSLEEFAGGAAHTKTAELTLPKLVKHVNPKYNGAAIREKVEGQVKLYALVGLDGRIERWQVYETAHPVLNAPAISALAEWRFEPGRLNNTPARVAVEVQMEFKLHRR